MILSAQSPFVAADHTRQHPPEGRTCSSPLLSSDDRLWSLDNFGRLAEIPDYADGPELAHDYEPRPVEFLRKSMGSLYALIENRCGEEITDEQFADALASAEILAKQQDRLAYKLSIRGIRTEEATQTKLYLVDPVTGYAIEQRQFRRVNIFPLVAQARRSKLLLEAEKFMESKHRVPYSRFITVTNGARIPLSLEGWQLFREQVQDLQHRAGTFNRQPWAKKYGLELVLRATEFGSLRKKDGTPWRDEQGRILLHPHLHCLLIFTKGPVPKQDWKRMLSKTGEISRHFGAIWDAGKPIRNLRECIKYPTKPADLELLTPDETLAFFQANFRLRMVEPLGKFREYRKSLRETRQKIVRWRGKDGKIQLKLVNDWNKHPIKDDPGRADALRRQRLKQDGAGATFRQILGIDNPPEKRAIKNMIVARIAPMPAFDRVFRPGILVLGYSGNLDAIKDHAAVAPIREAALRALSARSISVHTTHFIRRAGSIPTEREEQFWPSGGSETALAKPPNPPRNDRN